MNINNGFTFHREIYLVLSSKFIHLVCEILITFKSGKVTVFSIII